MLSGALALPDREDKRAVAVIETYVEGYHPVWHDR